MPDRYRLLWSPAALADLEGILDYLAARDSPAAARRVGRGILKQVDALASFPRRCRVVPELAAVGIGEYRERLASPHRIVFRVDGATVAVVAIFDGRRDLEELLLQRSVDAGSRGGESG